MVSLFYDRMFFYSAILFSSFSYFSSGGPLERGLERVLSNAPMGSLLVQSDAKTGEPFLFHVMLPACIRERHVAVDTWAFLLDAQVCLVHSPDEL